MFSVILCSHEKPEFVGEAIESVLAQTFTVWQLIIWDSGKLYDDGFFGKWNDERITVVRSWESPEVLKGKAPAPWCYNRATVYVDLADLVMYLCDDDILYPNCFLTFHTWFRGRATAMAAYASQDIGYIYPDGRREVSGHRLAKDLGGKNGIRMDGVVDGLQLCHRASLYPLLRKKYGEIWPESIKYQEHADGVLLDRIGQLTDIHPINIKTSCNRKTPISTYRRTH